MSAPELAQGTPSTEENTLIALRSGMYGLAAEDMMDGLRFSRSPGVLAVANTAALYGVSEALWSSTELPPDAQPTGYKSQIFDTYLIAAAEGDPTAISLLPKVATTAGQLVTALELILDNRSTLTEWRQGRSYVQFIGSFNPMHVGHRTSIATTLDVAGERSSAIVQAVADHPIKKDSLPPYRERFVPAEEKLYSSSLIDLARATMLDVPLSLGLAKVGTAQIRLIADVAGDTMRWQVGSDKFMADVRNVRQGKALDKAGARFSDVHLYVARRETEDTEELQAGIDYVRDRFGATVTLLPEATDPLVLSAAASKIRALRAEGNHLLADAMEFPDITVR
jgi:phosphopantetheine adenylyltransferase